MVAQPEPCRTSASASASVARLTVPASGSSGAMAAAGSVSGAARAWTICTGVPAAACSTSHALNASTVGWSLKNQMLGTPLLVRPAIILPAVFWAVGAALETAAKWLHSAGKSSICSAPVALVT